MLDGGNRAFVDLDLQGHAVTRLGHDIGFDLGRVTALGDILAQQFVTYRLEGGALVVGVGVGEGAALDRLGDLGDDRVVPDRLLRAACTIKLNAE